MIKTAGVFIGIITVILSSVAIVTRLHILPSLSEETEPTSYEVTPENLGGVGESPVHPLSIESLRQMEFPGSEIVIEQTLTPGYNYDRFIASYRSEGLKIYALLTVPRGETPQSGWPVIIFNHGYIPPNQYRTTERYVAYVDGFARSGYIVFKPDYRGHGNSEGTAAGGYGSNAYTIDVLNALAAMKKYENADENRMGMWGHSMGGHLTLRSMVVDPDIKAGVVWAGVVASYPDLIYNWRRPAHTPSPSTLSSGRRRWRDELVAQFGTPESNPEFWNALSANSFLNEISGPIQLHHGTNDTSVPVAFSQTLEQQLQASNQTVESYIYTGDDHNLTNSFSSAMARSIAFFDTYVKNSN